MAGVNIAGNGGGNADKGGKPMAEMMGKERETETDRKEGEQNLVISGRKSPTVRLSRAALCLREIQL